MALFELLALLQNLALLENLTLLQTLTRQRLALDGLVQLEHRIQRLARARCHLHGGNRGGRRRQNLKPETITPHRLLQQHGRMVLHRAGWLPQIESMPRNRTLTATSHSDGAAADIRPSPGILRDVFQRQVEQRVRTAGRVDLQQKEHHGFQREAGAYLSIGRPQVAGTRAVTGRFASEQFVELLDAQFHIDARSRAVEQGHEFLEAFRGGHGSPQIGSVRPNQQRKLSRISRADTETAITLGGRQHS